MPTRRAQPAAAANTEGLVHELSEALRRPAPTAEQPHVYEDLIGQTGSYHVLVVWDRWAEVDDDERSRIAVAAYEAADPEKARRLAVALALTPREAIDLGMRPFSVVSIAKPGEVAAATVRRALSDAGAVRTTEGLQLRFRKLAEAQEAFRRLQQAVPGPFWLLSQVERIGA